MKINFFKAEVYKANFKKSHCKGAPKLGRLLVNKPSH